MNYYEYNESVIYRSKFQTFKGCPNLVFWVEVDSFLRLIERDNNNNIIGLESNANIVLYLRHLGGEINVGNRLNYTAYLTVEGESFSRDEYYRLDQQAPYDYMIPVGPGIHTFSHDIETGERSITITAYIQSDKSNPEVITYLESNVLTFTVDLPMIPRCSEINVTSDIEVGEPFDIIVTPTYNRCTHTMELFYDDGERYRLINPNNDDKYSTVFTCNELSLEPRIDSGYSNFYFFAGERYENRTTGSFIIKYVTNNSDYGYGTIGTKAKQFYFTIPETVKPAVNHLLCDVINTDCVTQYGYDLKTAEYYGYIKDVCKARLFLCVDFHKSWSVNATKLRSYKVWRVDKNGNQKVIKEAFITDTFGSDEKNIFRYHDYMTSHEVNLSTSGADFYDSNNYDNCDNDYFNSLSGYRGHYGIEVVDHNLDVEGEVTYYATVTDKRDRTSEPVSVTIEIVDYNKPVVLRCDLNRCNELGNLQEDGESIKCEYKVGIPATSTATLTLKAYKGIDNSGELIETHILNSGSGMLDGLKILTNKQNNLDYYVELIVNDSVWGTIVTGRRLYPVNALIDVSPDGSVAIGKSAGTTYATLPTFEVNMKQKNYGHIVPNEGGIYDLGDSDHRWRTIYAVNAVNTSDINYKENISYVAPSNKEKNGEELVTQEDLHNFYKSDYSLATYNYIGQEQTEYGFITQDMYDNIVGETLIIRSDGGDMFSINSYISSIAGALQYEINLRDQQIAALLERIEALENGD